MPLILLLHLENCNAQTPFGLSARPATASPPNRASLGGGLYSLNSLSSPSHPTVTLSRELAQIGIERARDVIEQVKTRVSNLLERNPASA